MIARLLQAGLVACVLCASARAGAEPAPAPPAEDATFSIMSLLASRGLHDLTDERWNAYGQFSYITAFKLPFSAPYTNANGSTNSFNTHYERSFTATFSLFLGAKLWPGGELYYEPDILSERALSGLHGLGGVTEDFELQKTGSVTPTFYRARIFLRQTWNLGGATQHQDSKPLQLGGDVQSRRLVLTFGNYGVIDLFDKNNVLEDPRHTFFNEAFMTHSSYDFPADARGFTVGPALELYWDDWTIRWGHYLPPKNPNEQSLDFRFWERFGESLEFEHRHTIGGQPGTLRLLGYLNHVYSGRFDEAIAAFEADPRKNAGDCPAGSYNYGSKNFTAPDFCWVRRANAKLGVGINADQLVTKDVGLALRAMISDGQSEVDAYDSADADLSFAVVARGAPWRRPLDITGIGFQMSWISQIHAKYLAMGGVDGFIGDGHLRQAPEGLVETFYSANLFRAIRLAADYQLIWNPGYNADRAGPIAHPGDEDPCGVLAAARSASPSSR